MLTALLITFGIGLGILAIIGIVVLFLWIVSKVSDILEQGWSNWRG